MKKLNVLTTLVLALTLAACGKEEVKTQATMATTVTPSEPALPAAYAEYLKASKMTTGALNDKAALNKIKQALAATLKKDEAHITLAGKATFFDDGRVNLLVLDTDKKPLLATQYSYYNGVWNKAKEVKVKPTSSELKELIMPLSELDFNAPQQILLKTADKASSIKPHGKLNSYVDFIIFSKEINIKRGWIGSFTADDVVHKVRFNPKLDYIDTLSTTINAAE